MPEQYEAGAGGFCLEWRWHAIVSRPDRDPRRDPIVVWQCRHSDHETQRQAAACGERRIIAAARAGVAPEELAEEPPTSPAPPRTAYVLWFTWTDQDSSGSGQGVVAGVDAADAERRWREADPAEWPRYEVTSVEPLGDQVLTRYDE